MSARPLRALLILAVIGLTSTACARAVEMNTPSGQSYAVSVTNPMPHPMIVSFDDGSGERPLGTVGANRSERFVIAGNQGTTISVIAHDEGETHTVRKTVVLVPGETVQVTLSS